MGRLIKAEFRKILTTKIWWALLIPAVLLALGWAWGVSALITDIVDDVSTRRPRGVQHRPSTSCRGRVARADQGMNIATIFPMIFGALALASEISRKTITTSFLTAPNRASVLSAKADHLRGCGA